MNGIALHGGTRPYGGTFLVFSDYMRPAVRLAALMGLPVTYVWTHDSIGLGEDGPTHQPVEHLAALRAIPGLDVVRPADANETAVAWRTILEHTDRPAGLCLTRQDVPVRRPRAHGVGRGRRQGRLRARRRLRRAARGRPRRHRLRGAASRSRRATGWRPTGIRTRVVSMPCVRVVRRAGPGLPGQVLPPSVQRASVSVEAAIAQGWRDIVGDAGEIVSLDHFGASAPYQTLYFESSASRRPRPSPPPHAKSLAGAHRRHQVTRTRPRRTTMTDRLAALSAQGVAIWLDDLSRERLRTGNLADSRPRQARRRASRRTPPSSRRRSATARSTPSRCADLATRGVDVEEAVRMLTTYDVRWACDVMQPVVRRHRRHRRPGLHRGRPAARARHRQDRRRGPRAVVAGRPAQPVHQDPGHQGRPAGDRPGARRGHQRQRHADLLPRALPARSMEAFLDGIERARRAGHDLTRLTSVASFFVSRVDTEVDKRLDKIGSTGGDGAARARPRSPTPGWPSSATSRSSQPTAGPRWQPPGRKPQRPLWASTGVKDPAYDDTMYVVELVAPGMVNTMPEATLDAVADHGAVRGDTIRALRRRPQTVLDDARGDRAST